MIRVWFCNRRQKEKRINPPSSSFIHSQRIQLSASMDGSSSNGTCKSSGEDSGMILASSQQEQLTNLLKQHQQKQRLQQHFVAELSEATSPPSPQQFSDSTILITSTGTTASSDSTQSSSNSTFASTMPSSISNGSLLFSPSEHTSASTDALSLEQKACGQPQSPGILAFKSLPASHQLTLYPVTASALLKTEPASSNGPSLQLFSQLSSNGDA